MQIDYLTETNLIQRKMLFAGGNQRRTFLLVYKEENRGREKLRAAGISRANLVTSVYRRLAAFRKGFGSAVGYSKQSSSENVQSVATSGTVRSRANRRVRSRFSCSLYHAEMCTPSISESCNFCKIFTYKKFYDA